MQKVKLILFLCSSLIISGVFSQKTPEIIKGKQGDFQLIVNNKPYLMLGGELGNSATSDIEGMSWLWPKVKKNAFKHSIGSCILGVD